MRDNIKTIDNNSDNIPFASHSDVDQLIANQLHEVWALIDRGNNSSDRKRRCFSYSNHRTVRFKNPKPSVWEIQRCEESGAILEIESIAVTPELTAQGIHPFVRQVRLILGMPTPITPKNHPLPLSVFVGDAAQNTRQLANDLHCAGVEVTSVSDDKIHLNHLYYLRSAPLEIIYDRPPRMWVTLSYFDEFIGPYEMKLKTEDGPIIEQLVRFLEETNITESMHAHQESAKYVYDRLRLEAGVRADGTTVGGALKTAGGAVYDKGMELAGQGVDATKDFALGKGREMLGAAGDKALEMVADPAAAAAKARDASLTAAGTVAGAAATVFDRVKAANKARASRYGKDLMDGWNSLRDAKSPAEADEIAVEVPPATVERAHELGMQNDPAVQHLDERNGQLIRTIAEEEALKKAGSSVAKGIAAFDFVTSLIPESERKAQSTPAEDFELAETWKATPSLRETIRATLSDAMKYGFATPEVAELEALSEKSSLSPSEDQRAVDLAKHVDACLAADRLYEDVVGVPLSKVNLTESIQMAKPVEVQFISLDPEKKALAVGRLNDGFVILSQSCHPDSVVLRMQGRVIRNEIDEVFCDHDSTLRRLDEWWQLVKSATH